MIRLIADLIANGHAYAAEGHVLFHVPSMPDYGKLSNRSLDDMIAGARVEVAPYKKDPMDFVLWKPSKAGEPAWQSPWSNGRPGWHIECSAMAGALLGDTFDIHGGGIDLIFPHHENEIAQSRCAHGTDAMANYWLHNGFLQVEGEKMSKSLGNFVTIREAITNWRGKPWTGSAVRLAMLHTHYRQPIDWTESQLEEANRLVGEWSAFAKDAGIGPPPAIIVNALLDDLNTPQAIAALHALRRSGDANGLRSALHFLGVGLVIKISFEATVRMAASARGVLVDSAAIAEKADRLIEARAAARKAKNFAEADRIRAELDAMGIALTDAKDPETGELVTTWEVKR
jgi:cysteinyl-tRNA synthetase